MKVKKVIKVLSTVLLLATLLGALYGCGKTSASNATAEEVYNAIQDAFTESYGHEAIQNMPTEVNDTVLAEKFHLSPDEVEGYCGVIAGSMTNCDELLVVKAKDGETEKVETALQQALDEQREAFAWYAVMNNPERLEAAKIVTEGSFTALLLVGVSPEDDTVEANFEQDVAMAEKAFRDAIS